MYFWYFTISELMVHLPHQNETLLFNNSYHERLTITPSIIHGGQKLDAIVTFGSQEKYIAIEVSNRSRLRIIGIH